MYPLSKTHRRADRTFRSSYVVAFRGYVALERLTCSAVDVSRPVYHAANVIMAASGEQSTYVRVRVNNAPVPIPACQGGPGATCPLGDFARYLGVDMKGVAGNFGERCGVETGGVNDVRFLTQNGAYGRVGVGVN